MQNLAARSRLRLAILACSFALAACSQRAHHHAPPSGPAGVATFNVHADGDTIRVLAGIGHKGNPELALWHRSSGDGGASWSDPVRVNGTENRVIAAHPGENPSIAASGQHVIAAWTSPGRGFAGGGPLLIAVSEDGGRTWRRGAGPLLADASGAQSFAEITVQGPASHMIWLESAEGVRVLRYAQSPDRGASWTAPRTIAPATCECCWNRLIADSGGSLRALYRGVSPRDMLLAGASPGADWRILGPVGDFKWNVKACPHVGGALGRSDAGGTLHALAWTGRDDALGLYYLASADAGRSWSTPRRIGTDNAKRSDLAVGKDGEVTIVWDEASADDTAVMQSQSRDGGKTWSPPARVSAPGAVAFDPRVLGTGGGVAVFWREVAPGRGDVLKVNGRELEFPFPAP